MLGCYGSDKFHCVVQVIIECAALPIRNGFNQQSIPFCAWAIHLSEEKLSGKTGGGGGDPLTSGIYN